MNLQTNQLPPRRSRHTRPKASVGLKTWVRSGLLVFGLVFFGLIGLELYKANVAREQAEAVDMILTPPEAGEAKTAAAEAETGAETETAASEPTSVALPSTPAETAQPAEQTESASVAASPPATAASSAPASTSAAVAPQTESKPVQQKTESASAAPAPAQPAPEQKPVQPAQKPKVVKHVVQKGETLFMLSRKYYGNNSNVARIAKYNGLNAETQLAEGKVVFVPLSP
ncbi:hypothetical protein BAG01nite_01160 [Brevibacillus agri]|uniref:LysM domain-containing protein n=1 Tax=Brevibacillus agri TaxID=51101 RepID=A0A3M8AS07_9BACL|nr:LysM domain-containing protein [Brevibacillus agri]EJL40960.1 LysM domain-containing protein [Brevibacillus sp. CF112]ELK39275.1 hypothetical protein D478_25238 [Brevibacillus agri BAB-2500]QHZ56954.1 LysM peptidoglycan-binding domain-containing protein [Brevibacillus sp. NSP2.1]MBG9568736.1 hypothetical protein [Brevibacillus agri]MCG5249975.1 LysM peptidoglycan-binding domain-containing protein [Brevibacillus agri]